MREAINKQEPSSKDGGEVKAGDKVWVLCEVLEPEHRGCVKCANHNYVLHPYVDEIRPVEPSNSPKIPDSSNEPMRDAFEADMVQQMGWDQSDFARNENRYFDSQTEFTWQVFQAGAKYQPSPLAPSPCMDGVNVDPFVDGVMEARGRTSDPINPSHYKQGGIECIEAIKAALGEGFPDYLRGNVIKYLWRYKEKGGVDDLKKARWYLDRLIQEVGE